MDIRDFRLERYMAQYEFSAPYLLCSSDCETLSVQELFALEEGSAQEFQTFKLGYTEAPGSPELREEISAWYELVDDDEVIVTSGAEETIFITMHTLLKPGDHVIVQMPSYQSLHEIPKSLGCHVSPWQMAEKNGAWHLDIEALHEHITPKTKALVINSPHNPTGYQFSKSDWHAIEEICADHSIFIVSDEVYRGIEHDTSKGLKPMADLNESALSIGVMSKSLGLAGLRIGWAASRNDEFRKKFQAFKDYTTICNSGPSEYLATVALRQKEQIIRRNLAIIHDNMSILHTFFKTYADQITWSAPTAGSTAFPRLATDASIESFCDKVRDDQGVLLLPGSVFHVETPHFRIGYGRRNMPEILSRFEQCLQSRI
ncbi:aminotransferase class I/II-fold pyridoxal phosphate-dependent enzyme [uncultured Methanospirillum sp.]|uniref:aminotransferase class I/II-fold pyridoxal phosphate-dependent enzyme n=1 Tax=uncultured Methanospirillum sp. TaxID=262503 RepID=UPI0029C7C77E|nr:aminotransferase class I/II-fold pyridoxal phosphate-dependent enzyme [uncultured Methanospirillum sp.]